MGASAIDRFNDLQKQGFMKPRAEPRAAKPAPPTVACEDCLNWHAKGRHTSDTTTRKARRRERKSVREDHKLSPPARSEEDGHAYRACFAAAVKLGVIEAYHADLTVHDRQTMNRTDRTDPTRRFLWCVGKCGTTLVFLDPPKGETWGANDEYRSVARCRSLVDAFGESRPFMHLWDGARLEEISPDRAVALLVEKSESEDA